VAQGGVQVKTWMIDTDKPTPGALPMFGAFLRAYPGRSAAALLSLLLAGLLDGLGLSTLLSMLSIATGGSDDPSLPERAALEVTAWLGVTPTAATLLLLAVALISTKAAMVLVAQRQVGYTVAHVATDLRLSLIRAVMASRWRYYLSQPVGRLSNAIATEAERASVGYLQGAMMTTYFINSLIYTIVALLLSWQASIAALVAGATLLAGLQVLVRISGRAGRKQTLLLKSLLTSMTDQLGAAKALKAMARERHVDSLLSGQTRQLKSALRRQVISKEAVAALQEPLLAILVGIGFFIFVVQLEMSLPEVLVILFLLARVVNFLAKAQRAYQNMAITESAYWSLREAIDEAERERETAQGERAPSLEREIRLDSVSFSHDVRPVLHELSLVIPAGELTVITGPSGAGKTTLVDLVVGLLDPDDGRILVDGVPLAEIDRYAWRRQIGYVPQEPLLVNDSVLRNVTLGEPGFSEADARAALEAADAWEFVSVLPQGMNSSIGERGGQLSGGQRQRLAIARALVHRPRLLILDEATSNLDPDSEAAVLETIERLKGRLTMLAVSHDEGLVRAADHVARLEPVGVGGAADG
jgi:ATP-binding cassette, subfamily C, bacterial